MAGDQLARILDAGAAFHPAFAQVAELRDQPHEQPDPQGHADDAGAVADGRAGDQRRDHRADQPRPGLRWADLRREARAAEGATGKIRSEEHTSELQSLMRSSYAVFSLKNKT